MGAEASRAAPQHLIGLVKRERDGVRRHSEGSNPLVVVAGHNNIPGRRVAAAHVLCIFERRTRRRMLNASESAASVGKEGERRPASRSRLSVNTLRINEVIV